MLEHVQAWVAINSGTANLDGLAQIAEALADTFSALPGTLRLVEPEPVEAVSATGAVSAQPHGHHLHLAVRPDAPVQMLFTGHMDTVYPADHPFQDQRFLDARSAEHTSELQ